MAVSSLKVAFFGVLLFSLTATILLATTAYRQLPKPPVHYYNFPRKFGCSSLKSPYSANPPRFSVSPAAGITSMPSYTGPLPSPSPSPLRFNPLSSSLPLPPASTSISCPPASTSLSCPPASTKTGKAFEEGHSILVNMLFGFWALYVVAVFVVALWWPDWLRVWERQVSRPGAWYRSNNTPFHTGLKHSLSFTYFCIVLILFVFNSWIVISNYMRTRRIGNAELESSVNTALELRDLVRQRQNNNGCGDGVV